MNKLAVDLTPLAHQDLKSLLEHRGKPAVSIYLPQDSLANVRACYRQVPQEAESQLEEYELNPQELAALVTRLHSLQEHPPFWRQACAGLALYVSAEHFLYSCSAFTPEKRVVVDDFFYVIPLLSHYLRHRSFHILNLNGDQPQLYVASQREIRPLPLRAAALNQLARDLQEYLQHQLSPLLVVCSEPARFEAFRVQLRQTQLELDCHHCTADVSSVQRLHRQAWKQIAPLLHQEQDEALRSYQALQNTPKAVQDVLAVAQAAYNSRVEKLFLVIPRQPGPGHHRIEELLNRAAIYTYLNGGKVYTVQPEQAAGIQEAAAILRY